MILSHRHNFIYGCDCCCCNSPAFLFDLYPGAAVGYSVRKLSSTYLGAAMQVRRSSDNTTLDIGFSGEDLDTASLLAFAGAGSAFVSIWYDQSGAGNNMIQATTTRQPQIVNTGVLVVENGLPILTPINETTGMLSAYNPNAGATTKTLFTVLRGYDAANCIFGSNTGGSDYGYLGVSGDVSTAVNGIFLTVGNQHRNGTSWVYTNRNNVYTDLLNQSLVSTNCNFSFQNPVLGLGYRSSNPVAFQMNRMQEFIVYNSNESANRVAIEANINAYYNIY